MERSCEGIVIAPRWEVAVGWWHAGARVAARNWRGRGVIDPNRRCFFARLRSCHSSKAQCAMQSLSDSLPSISSFVELATDKDAWLVQAVMALAYMLFYTAYDKTTKKLSMSLLLDFLFIRPGPAKNRGLTWALNEWNKLISLVAISSLGLCLVRCTPRPFAW